MNVSNGLGRAVSAALPALWAMTVIAGCAAYQQQVAIREAASNVIVTPGDINWQYDILGTIQWPGAGYRTLFGTPCTPEKLREEAFARWGYSVSAIIGYTSWNDSGQIQCLGTAVRFTRGSSAPRDTGLSPEARREALLGVINGAHSRGQISDAEYERQKKAILDGTVR